jgi:hypothetical protein
VLRQPITQLLSIIGPVSQQLPWCWRKPENGRGTYEIVRISCGNDQSARLSRLVSQRMDFGRTSPSGRSNGVVESPPFPPAAERWALM